VPDAPARGPAEALRQALALHAEGRLEQAEDVYRSVLAREPDIADAQHMLGVIQLQRGDHAAALRLLRRAAELFDWRVPAVFHNLGLAMRELLVSRDVERTSALRAAYGVWQRGVRAASRTVPARISVAVPSFNHAAYVEEALASVYAQTHAPCELIVIDDGSSDDSVRRIAAMLARCPWPSRLIARENRGAAATINEAVALSSGDYVNVLNSDDRYAPTRLASMAAAVAGSGSAWGFSRVALIDSNGAPLDPDASPRAAGLRALVDAVASDEDSAGMSLLAANGAISTGALFFSRTIFDRLAGFRDLRYNHDWDFCLRASTLAEPIVVDTPEYEYRLHTTNTILEDAANVELDASAMFSRYYREVLALAEPPNPFAPVPAVWGARFFERALARGHAPLLPAHALRALIDELLAQAPGARDD
jgi:glycosyltransferase involved in cell wall biosynthesis